MKQEIFIDRKGHTLVVLQALRLSPRRDQVAGAEGVRRMR